MGPFSVRVDERALLEARVGLMRVTSRIVLFVFLPAIGLSALHNWSRLPAQHASFTGLLSGIVLVAALIWRPLQRLLVLQALLFIAVFLAVFGLAVYANGPQPGSISAACVMIAWSTLFFGGRGLVAVLGALLGVFALMAWHFSGGPPVQPDLLPNDLEFWIRAGTIFLTSGALVGLIVLAAMRAYVRTVAREREALAVAAHEENRRLSAEAESDVLQRRYLGAALASGLAHDLNNLIQVTGANAEMLRESAVSADDRDSIEQILAAADRARRMVRELLALGRPPSLALHAPEFDGTDVVRRLELMLRSAMPARVRLECIAHDGCWLLGDELRFEQVLINLVLNARDAMPAGGVLSVALRAETKAVCRLDVRDTGHGIAPEVRERIFTPFFSTKPAGEGSGVGLSSVSRAVQDVGGRVTFESTPGAGTLFSVFWPRRATDEPVAS